MSGPKKLTGSNGKIGPEEAEASNSEERKHATLLRNDLIAGDEEIVARVMESAKFATFPSGHKLIEQGDTDDCVYFIIAGSTKVRINNRHIDVRGAPHTVGEMAAKKAGEVRTADVIVQSKQLDALVLSGTDFRKIMQDFPGFSDRLAELIDNLSRSKIAQLGEAVERKGLPWVALSGIVSVGAGVIGGAALWAANFDLLYVFWGGLSVALAGFVCMVQLNPDFRYRNISGMAAIALILSIVYGSISFAVTVDGQRLDLPLIDFSVNTDQKLKVHTINSFVLLALATIMAIFDLKLTSSRNSR
ncbi:cyclic nucleotide-binding domain-containing protein [bacterium SCSIO 12827]|nr:cyclic nucleotide-binding domain-containing protein [bacterium SCSIO 12827]